MIDKATFSIYLAGENDELQSNLMIGGYNLEKYSSAEKFTYVDVENTGYWSLAMHGIQVGDKQVEIRSSHAVLDTGSSLLMGPVTEVAVLQSYLSQEKECRFYSDLLM